MKQLRSTIIQSSTALVVSMSVTGSCLAQAHVESPIVETVRLRTTVSAPASIARPTMPSREATRAYILSRREMEKRIRKIWGKYLGSKTYQPGRERGMMELAEITDKAAVEPFIEVLRKDDEDVRQWLMEHFADRYDPGIGQPTLAWLAIHDEEERMREQALAHLKGEPQRLTRRLVLESIQSPNQQVVSGGAQAAGALHMAEAIPHLMAAQVGSLSMSGEGDMAFIMVGEQRYFVSDLQPVVGTNSVGLDPTLSPITTGTVIRVQDAVVEFFNADAHGALVNIVRDEFGQNIDFGYDKQKWQNWYDQEYMPFVRARDAENGGQKRPGG